jgi:hypothetical protein
VSALDQLVQLVPLAAKKALATKASNVTLVPATVPATVKHGALVHKDAGPARGSALPARVVAVLGPGATFQGLAATLLPMYAGATGARPLTADELAKGVVVYNRGLLPAGTWGNHQVGLCLPLPIEIDAATGAWTLNADEVRGWAASFQTDWRSRLSIPPTRLGVLGPAEIEGEARSARTLPRSVAGQQWERALRNPSEAVLTFIAIVRQMRDDGPTGSEQALTFALAFLDDVQAHHVALLAATTAGNGILRRVAKVLETDPLPPHTDMAKLAAARTLVDNALFQGPPAARTLRPPQEVPETADLLAARPGSAKAVAGAKADPGGGLHRIVLGRDVAVGRSDPAKVGGVTFTGPAFGGRLLLDPVLEDDAVGLNRGHNPDRDGRLALLSVHGVGGGPLDAVKLGGAGVLSVGLGAWSASDPAGVPGLLLRFKLDAADEFDLFFALHGLDVGLDPTDPNKVQLKKIGADGKPSTVLSGADLVAFFGGTVDATTGAVRFSSEWAARFRLPALVSRRYRRAQILEALKKLTPDPVELAIASVSPFPSPYTLAIDVPKSTALKTAVDVDMDVDGFLAGLPATVPSKDTLSGALIDLTAGAAAPTAYASSRASDDEDTFNIASMGKMLAMYAAFELRFRLRKALRAAESKGLDVTVANWDTRFRKLVERTWSGRVARGFPGFDTRMPARFPKLGDMFTFTTVPAAPPPGRRIGQIDFKHGTATDTEIIHLNLGSPDLSKMKFLELIKSMVFMSNAIAASLVIDAVGYPYLNGALREGGFFDPASKKGLWVSGNYRSSKGDWKPPPRPDVDAMDLSPRGTAHYKSTTNFMGNARQLALLLALLDRGELFDGADATACSQMRLIMRRHALPGVPLPDVSFIKDDIEATPPPVGPLVVDEAFSKIGIGVHAPHSTLEGAHDAAIIQRKKGATTLRYVAVVIGGYGDVPTGNLAAARRLTQLLDEAIAKVHP